MTITDPDPRAFAADPIGCFRHSRRAMHTVEPGHLATLQLAALRMRFAELGERLPMLRVLADEQRVEEISGLDDVAGLLLPHTVYKSYPLSLLWDNRFDQLTRWLSRLTTVDLSGLDVSGCDSIDSWLELLDTHTTLRLAHSSGTTGTMSFIPHTYADFDRLYQIVGLEVFGRPQGKDEHIDVVWPGYRTGRGGVNRHIAAMVDRFAGSPDRFHARYPGLHSADVMFLAGQLRAAAAHGRLDQLEIPPALRRRREEFEAAQRAMHAGMGRFAQELADRAGGRRVISLSVWSAFHELAGAGLARGLRGVFAPDSVILGGAKGPALPNGWSDTIREFAGVPAIRDIYAMAEVTSLNLACSAGRFHIEPWVILYVLDPDTGAPLPRRGQHTGRAAFFDLLAEDHWGGFVSGDEITANFSPCACGRSTPHLAMTIRRYADQRGDDKITCAMSAEALGDALDYLTESLT